MSQETGNARYIVTSAPHIFAKDTVQSIMLDVIIALMPALVIAGFYFRGRALIHIIVSVVASVFFEWAYQKFTKQKVTVSDLSAVVTGLLIAFNLPAAAPLWFGAFGALVAIVVVKQVFGGLGQNFINPALIARAVLLASIPQGMTDFSILPVPAQATDAVSLATPLAQLKDGSLSTIVGGDLMDALLGFHGGTIGEICAIALIIGGLYLIVRKVISWHIPATYIGVVFILSLIFGRNGIGSGSLNLALYEILTGGLLLGAFFMATDYATSPMTKKGQIIFGIGCGIITFILRFLSKAYPEGVSYSILLMNLTVPLIDKWTAPKVFGKVEAEVENA